MAATDREGNRTGVTADKPTNELLLWMAVNGSVVELIWDEDGRGWSCRWSRRTGTAIGIGASPHAAIVDAVIKGG